MVKGTKTCDCARSTVGLDAHLKKDMCFVCYAGERVTLLPSPVAAGASIAARSPSTLRYGGAGAVDAFTAGLEAEGHAEHHHAGLGRSDMSTIAALNPSGHAARQLSSQGTGQSPGLYIRTPSAQPIHAIQGMSLLQSAAASPVSARAHTLLTPVSARAGSGQGGTLQAFCTPSATTSQGPMNAGMGQWPKGAGLVYGEHGAAAGSCLHAAEQDGMHGGSGADPDAQYDDDFEEYEDSDDGQDDAEHAGSAEQGVGLEHAGPHETRQHADVDAVRQSMAVLTHLLDIKISQVRGGAVSIRYSMLGVVGTQAIKIGKRCP